MLSAWAGSGSGRPSFMAHALFQEPDALRHPKVASQLLVTLPIDLVMYRVK